ncbi:PREDICTED: uncharacterized protein LOC105455555 isoform X2 [Wasmannia auropunctata]|uniref:uncharacterized protein LOC105455555 isoform X2 n=1 Tax=Wasmannia auropunctata TaxID=64793 RepID=UPI0005ED9B8A|nr:PREDICTED: uncharacterized protein LOC105455555 isoform X2 [Wasmannia auropunctata]
MLFRSFVTERAWATPAETRAKGSSLPLSTMTIWIIRGCSKTFAARAFRENAPRNSRGCDSLHGNGDRRCWHAGTVRRENRRFNQTWLFGDWKALPRGFPE